MRVAAAYLVIGWLVIQVIGALSPIFEISEGFQRGVVLLLAVGFVPALFFSWAFEITPDGIKKEKDVDRDSSIANVTAKKLNLITVAAAVGVFGLFLYQQINPAAPIERTAEPVAASENVVPPEAPQLIEETSTPIDDLSIAVLPFADMSPAGDQEYFTDGLTENLLHALAQIREIKVAGRTSSFAYKGSNVDLREIGQVLNVKKILEGSVQKSGDQIRITAQLINADDGFHIFSRVFDRKLEDIFAVQDEITNEVVKALREDILGEENPNAGYSGNFEAYNAYLLGMNNLHKNTTEGWDKALEHFEEAIRLDPNMALAWAGLSSAQSAKTGFGTNFTEGFAKARAAATKAIALDPDLPEAHMALAGIQRSYDWDWDGLEASLRRAAELRPGDTDIALQVSQLKWMQGDRAGSFADLNKLLALDPLNDRIQERRVGHLRVLGRTDEALAIALSLVQKYPERGVTHFRLASIYQKQGEYEKALAAIEQEPFTFMRLQGEAIVYNAIGKQEIAQQKLQELIDTFGDDASWQVASVYASWGDADQVFAALDRGYAARDPGIIYIRGNEDFRPFWGDPRYQAFLEKIGLD